MRRATSKNHALFALVALLQGRLRVSGRDRIPTVRKTAAISVFAVIETALISSPHGYGVNQKNRDAVLAASLFGRIVSRLATNCGQRDRNARGARASSKSGERAIEHSLERAPRLGAMHSRFPKCDGCCTACARKNLESLIKRTADFADCSTGAKINCPS